MRLRELIKRISEECEESWESAREGAERFLKSQSTEVISDEHPNGRYHLKTFPLILPDGSELEVVEWGLSKPSSFALEEMEVELESDVHFDGDNMVVTGNDGLHEHSTKAKFRMLFRKGDAAEQANQIMDHINTGFKDRIKALFSKNNQEA